MKGSLSCVGAILSLVLLFLAVAWAVYRFWVVGAMEDAWLVEHLRSPFQ